MPADALAELDNADLAAGTQGTFAAVIGQNLGTPGPDVLALIPDIYGRQLTPDDVFIFPGQPTNSLLDSYFTYMRESSLRNYVADFTEGRGLMLGHAWGDQPVGYSFGAELQQDDSGAEAARTARAGGQRDLMDGFPPMDPIPAPPTADPGAAIQRVFARYYIVRGQQSSSQLDNDNVIRNVETRTYRDLSIGFQAGDIICDLCGMSVLSWDCPHIPGARYEVNGIPTLARAGVEDGHALETSFGFKGATPQAGVVPVKARLVAMNGGLSRQEACRLIEMEARLGKRLVDPAQLQRAMRTISTARPRQEDPMPLPAQRAAARPQRRADTPPPAPAGSEVEQVIADQSTQEAQALADQMAAQNDQIAALQAEIDANNQQIAALQNATDANGDPLDNTEQIAALQATVTAQQDQMTSLTDELAALQAELDAINGTAQATGGTPTDAPAPALPAAQGNLAGHARAALTQARASITRHVAPVIGRRDVAPTDLQPILDGLSQLVQQLQGLLEAAGQAPPQTGTNLVIFNALRRAIQAQRETPVTRVSFQDVQTLLRDAEAGRTVRAQAIEACVAGQVRALGATGFDADAYRRMIQSQPLPFLQGEVARLDAAARTVLQAGRQVRPLSLHEEQDGQATPATVFEVAKAR